MVGLVKKYDELRMAARLLGGLRGFLRGQPDDAAADRVVEESFAARQSRFLELMRRGVYDRPDSPYRPLLLAARIDHPQLTTLVAGHGVDGALARLYDAGVYLSLDEFKGRQPIRRGALTVPTSGSAFDNPLLVRHYATQTSGSRGTTSRLIIDLDLLAHEACYERVFLQSFGLSRRPKALWHPGPPGSAGLKTALRFARLGHRVERWFSQTPTTFAGDSKHAMLVAGLAATSRLAGRAIPRPEHVPLDRAAVVAAWLAARRDEGTPAFLSTTASCAVRVCAAARELGVNISGTFFRASGEPLTPGKIRAITEAGCEVRCHYAMAEVSRIGIACARPAADDDVHVAIDKVALLERETTLVGGARVKGLHLTTLHWSAPKLMINVELGDFGVLGTRQCGCPWDRFGFTTHLHTIRSYEKLTSEGMHFTGSDLLALVDDLLPRRFGGAPTDYQFVEEERGGLPSVSLIVSPRVNGVSADAVADLVLRTLGARDPAHRMMAAIWRDGRTLTIVRREPHATRTGKILALHVARPGAAA